MNPTFTFGALRPLDKIYDDDAGLNLGPRVGFAYNVNGEGTTVLNGGWGMMFQPYDTQNFEPSISNIAIPRAQSYTVQEAAAAGLKWPFYSNDLADLLISQHLPPLVGILIDPHLQSPYAMVFTFGVQHALTKSLVMEPTYVDTRRFIRDQPDLQRSRSHHGPPSESESQQRGVPRQLSEDDVSRAAGLAASADVAQHDVQPQLHPLDEQVPHGRRRDARLHRRFGRQRAGFLRPRRGLGTLFRRRQTFVRRQRDLSGAGRRHVVTTRQGPRRRVAVLRDLPRVNGSAASHHAVVGEIEQPPGRHRCGERGEQGVLQLGEPSGTLNPAAFTLVPINAVSRETVRAGNVGNGQFRGPNFRNVDFSLAKPFRLAGRSRIEIRCDMLNALNWTNYTSIQTSITATNFGQVTGLGDARVVQIQARFSF